MSRTARIASIISIATLLASVTPVWSQTQPAAMQAVPEIVPVASVKASPDAGGAVDLGADPSQPGATVPASAAVASTAAPVGAVGGTPPSAAGRAVQAAKSPKAPKKSKPAAAPARESTEDGAAVRAAGAPGTLRPERVLFERAPVRIDLVADQERRVVFPNPVALQVPRDAAVTSQVIERTAYITASEPMQRVRVIAEDLVTGQMVPVDLYAVAAPASKQAPHGGTSSSSAANEAPEVEVFYKGEASSSMGGARRSSADAQADDDDDAPAALDAVALTRYAAQMTYAPRRLLPSVAGVRQVPVRAEPVAGLLRGVRLAAVPLGQWRSGELFVTAVRVTNLEHRAVDLNLDDVRGSWTSATAQHTRLMGAGSGWETSTLYLVCDRPFEACR